MLTNFFGSKPSAHSTAPSPLNKEQFRSWITGLKREQRHLERDRQSLIREELKLKNELKRIAKSGNARACHTMAKSVLQSQRQCDKLLMASTQINSIISQLRLQSASVNVIGQISKSAELMATMNALVKVPAIAESARAMSREMARTGLIDDMIDDALGMNDDELNEQADAEVDKVLYELTDGMLGQIGTVKGRAQQVKEQRQERKVDEAVAGVEQ